MISSIDRGMWGVSRRLGTLPVIAAFIISLSFVIGVNSNGLPNPSSMYHCKSRGLPILWPPLFEKTLQDCTLILEDVFVLLIRNERPRLSDL